MAIIKSTVEVCLIKLENGKPIQDLAKSLETVNQEVENMTDLMENILALESMEAKTFDRKIESIDVVGLVVTLVEKHHYINPGDMPLSVKCINEKRNMVGTSFFLRRAISNLISNAIKYSQGKATPQIVITFLKNEIIISIKDFGIGIPKNEIDAIFEPFRRGSNVAEISGNGLGLAITKQFIEMNDGTIKLKSELGYGSEFIIQFKQ